MFEPIILAGSAQLSDLRQEVLEFLPGRDRR
jgi:hypothetical protein